MAISVKKNIERAISDARRQRETLFYNTEFRPVYTRGTEGRRQTAAIVLDNEMVREYVALNRIFESSLAKFKSFYPSSQLALLQALFNKSVATLLTHDPDSISLQLTYDGSIFFTFLKDVKEINFEVFLDTSSLDGDDEVVVSILEEGSFKLNFGGSFENACQILESNFAASEEDDFEPYYVPSRTFAHFKLQEDYSAASI